MIQGKKYDKSIDMWCLGIIIYEMLTGWPPFVAESRNKIFIKIMNDSLYFDPLDKISAEAQDLI